MELSKRLYTQFIYKFHDIENYTELNDRITKAGFTNNVYIRDISLLSEEETVSEINAVMAAEKTRYAHDREPEVFLTLFKTGEKTYVAILSINERMLLNENDKCRKICNILFKQLPSDAKYWSFEKTETQTDSIHFWGDKFKAYEQISFKSPEKGKGEYFLETFPMDKAVADSFAKAKESGKDPLAMCNSVLANILSRVFSTDKLIINSSLIGTPLTCAPLVYVREDNLKKSYEQVSRALNEIQEHCFCTRYDLFKDIGKRYYSKISASASYFDEKTYERFIEKMRSDILYNELSADMANAPLNVFLRFFDGKMNMTYIYDRYAVKNIDMSKFHAAFEGMLKAFLDSDVREEKDISAKTVESTTNVVDRIELAKYAVLRKAPLFEQYEDAELKALCAELKLVHINAKTNILMAGDVTENLYLLCSGNIEALGINRDRFANPLYLVKPGDVFGVECILRDRISHTQYRTLSDVVILSMGADVLKREARNHPELIKELLEVQSKLLTRFQRLWMMS